MGPVIDTGVEPVDAVLRRGVAAAASMGPVIDTGVENGLWRALARSYVTLQWGP